MTTTEPDKNLTCEQERVEAMWSPGLGVIVVRNTASGDKVEFGEEAWQAFLDGHRGISGESGRRLAALRDLHAPYGIYDELDHFHDPYEDQWPDGHDRVNAGVTRHFLEEHGFQVTAPEPEPQPGGVSNG